VSDGRYAVYFAPAAGSPWWTFAAHWVGRDEASGAALPQPCPEGFDAASFAQLTAEPRRYGFHATLRPPMRLKASAQAFEQEVRALASRLRAVPLGTLVPVYMDGFVALVPSVRNPALGALAAQCVTTLEPLRQPLDETERARRRPEQLDARGRELVDLHGYPGVLERFRFHMTLTGPVDTATAGRLVAHLANPVARLNAQSAPVLDRLCIFHEAQPGAPFLRVGDVELAA
jgi:putative phosphonate metabolism protein